MTLTMHAHDLCKVLITFNSERDMDTPAAEALREMGYRNAVIERAIDQWRRSLRPGEARSLSLSLSLSLTICSTILTENEKVLKLFIFSQFEIKV